MIKDLIEISTTEIKNANFRKSLNRLLLAECIHNLNILGLIKDDKNNSKMVYMELFKQLETNKIELYYTNASLYSSFFKKIKDQFVEDELNDDLLLNILLKIKILKTISIIPNISELKAFKFNQRKINLTKKLKQLLEHLNEIK